MNATQLFYKSPGGTAGGPLEWSSILAAFHAGRLPQDAMVAHRDQGPWVGVGAVERAGLETFMRGEIRTVQAAIPPVKIVTPAQASKKKFDAPILSIFLQGVGVIGLVCAVICIIVGVAEKTMLWVMLGLSSGLSSALCLAVGKILETVTFLEWKTRQ